MKCITKRAVAIMSVMALLMGTMLAMLPTGQVRAAASKEVSVVYGHYDDNKEWVEDERKGTATVKQTVDNYDSLLDEIEYIGVYDPSYGVENGYRNSYAYGLVFNKEYTEQSSNITGIITARFSFTLAIPDGYDLAYDGSSKEKKEINNGTITISPISTTYRPTMNNYAKGWVDYTQINYANSEEIQNDIFGSNAMVKSVPSGKKVVGVTAISNIYNRYQICGETLLDESYLSGASVVNNIIMSGNNYSVQCTKLAVGDTMNIELPVKEGATQVYYQSGTCDEIYYKNQEFEVVDGRFSATIPIVERQGSGQGGYITIAYSRSPSPQPIPDTSGNVITINEDAGIAIVKDNVRNGYASVPISYITEGDVYRMYDPSRGEHFYTKNASEMQQLVNSGWVHEEDSDFTVVAATDDDAVPVYRLYNPNDGGMHFYTENATEAQQLAANGWSYEGISHYVYDKNSGSGVAQYRLYNPNSTNGEHNWTTSIDEYNMLKAAGWTDEGVCWNIK